jgi:hypothetical protein
MNDIDEKRKNTEKINFAMQGMAENAQSTIAIAVSVFGILTLFFMIHMGENPSLDKGQFDHDLSYNIISCVLGIGAFWLSVLLKSSIV